MTLDCDFMNFKFICCILPCSCQCHQLNLRDRETRILAHVTHKLYKTHRETHTHKQFLKSGINTVYQCVSKGVEFFILTLLFRYFEMALQIFVLAVVTSLLPILIFLIVGIVFTSIFNVHSIK